MNKINYALESFKNIKKTLLSLLAILLIQFNLSGQESQSNEIKICEQTISFSSNCIANQGFQSLKSDDFHLMWLYLKQKSGMQGSSIYKNNNGEISYTSDYSLDYIRKKGFSIYPKKKHEVIITPANFIVLGESISGNIIELKSKKSSLYYLMACGKICGNEMGFQVKLNSKQLDNDTLNSELQKIIKFQED